MKEIQQRQRLVQWALAMTADTALAPSLYERQLLEEYVQGRFSIEEVLFLLDALQTALLTGE